MRVLDKPAWEVLNATADDWENLEQMYQLLGVGTHGGREARPSIALEEIADRVDQLMRSGLLEGRYGASGDPVSDLTDLTYVWRAWFRMTPQGREAWANSDWAKLVEQESNS